jgi:acetyl esterase
MIGRQIQFATYPATTSTPLDLHLVPAVEALALAVQTEQLSPGDARAAARARVAAAPALKEPVARTEDRAIPGPGGKIPVRIYLPSGVGPFPAVVYYHGGGWLLGDLEDAEDYCRSICHRVKAVVVSVEYRLAPQHRFPAAPEDCYAALTWVHANARTLGVDPARLAVAGLSAGGNLAAAVALMARDRGGPAITHQVLIVPVTNHQFDTASYHAFAEGYGLTRSTMIYFWHCYLARPEDAGSPYASVLRAPDLQGLPPALVQTAEYDPLRDEGEAYAHRLHRAGIPVRLVRYLGMPHGFLRFAAVVDGARQAVTDAAEALGTALTR